MRALIGFALFWLTAVGQATEPAIERLRKARTAQEVAEARKALNALGPQATTELRSLYRDDSQSAEKRGYAFRTAMHLLPHQQALKEIQDEFDRAGVPEGYRMHIVMEMGRFKDAAVRERLRRALSDKKERGSVQVISAWSLAAQGDDSGKARALQAVLNSEPWRDSGIETLVVLGAKDTFPQLRAGLQSQNSSIRNSCRLAILRLQNAKAEPKEEISALRDALNEDGYFDVRIWAARRLVEIGGQDAGKTLLAISKDLKSPGQESAQRGLMEGITKQVWTRDEVNSWVRE